MTVIDDIESRLTQPGDESRVVYRHRVATRVTHWTWAIALFFLLLSGLQIFNAHPTLYIGNQSGFEFDNSVLSMRAMQAADGKVDGYTTVFGRSFKTTGVLGMSGPADNPSYRGFPAWATLPSYQDLSTGRVIHFFFAWFFVAAFLVWFVSSLISGHLKRDILPSLADIRALPQSLSDHLRFRFHHDGRYNGLQKLSYAGVLLVIFPVIILTGLAMSPGMNAAWPWLLDVFGGRQTARTIHFLCMALLVAFFLIHIFMVFAAGPLNEMRSIITGWYRTDPEKTEPEKKEEHTA
ncbi:cytochrome b/b6 domain-containing protein [Pararhizobium sp. BT-229]|uniref:cytochrome b/b6 domain-containing protein n=1 Tax=Pararhizobium sp. BT-229 TaxID=2986923 RepID=UPI0021F7ED1A|nr:cytochrome b/b6 domain-containing protein [Pararhizobium sp. BT-229]MCV9960577.1 cytochrome b/b6 domain-containing protein [Pararhizobium sp. BT-229]